VVEVAAAGVVVELLKTLISTTLHASGSKKKFSVTNAIE
jgi:hypothetical protein